MTVSRRLRLPLSGGGLFIGALSLINVSLIGYGLYRALSDHAVSAVPVGRLASVTYHSGFFQDETTVVTDQGGYFLVEHVFPGVRGHALVLETLKYGDQRLCDPVLHVCRTLAR